MTALALYLLVLKVLWLPSLGMDPLVQKVLLQTAFRVLRFFVLEGAVKDCAGVVSFGVEGTVEDITLRCSGSLCLKLLNRLCWRWILWTLSTFLLVVFALVQPPARV